MADYKELDYKVFEMFRKQWAVAAAGTVNDCDGCTIGWGSLGTLWPRPGSDGSIMTIYIYPTRHTLKYLQEHDTFTVSFFPEEYKKALGYMGSRSGREEDKAKNAGLTPVEFHDSVTYKEANLVFYCRTIYRHQLTREDIAEDVQAYYKSKPGVYPVDENGDWNPHWVFVGDILDVKDLR